MSERDFRLYISYFALAIGQNFALSTPENFQIFVAALLSVAVKALADRSSFVLKLIHSCPFHFHCRQKNSCWPFLFFAHSQNLHSSTEYNFVRHCENEFPIFNVVLPQTFTSEQPLMQQVDKDQVL